MRTLSLVVSLFALLGGATAQHDLPREAAEAVRVGRLLYASEQASWNGTDLFMERFPQKRDRIGGYLSYANGTGTTCLFFTAGDQPRSLARFTFDGSFNKATAVIDTSSGPLTADEEALRAMRSAALVLIRSDDLFVLYEKMNFNLIPLMDRGERSVYVLCGPTENGVMLFGNDYLIELDKNNKVRSRRKLHNNLIPVEFTSKEGVDIIASTHSHVKETGDFITATDVCTLLLYSPFAPMTQHYVMSDKAVSIWDCRAHQLTVVDRKAWDRINKDQQERHPEVDP